MARATGSINFLEHRTPLKDESGKYQIHPMFVKRDICLLYTSDAADE